MSYSLREIECFIAVAEALSFTRAAKRLNMAQPPLSRHIRTLEEKIGAQLFSREPRRVSLTAAGSLFYDDIRNVPRLLNRAGEAARRCSAGETARLRLGFVSAVMNDELVDSFRRYRERHPGVQIMLHDSSPNDQLKAIAEGRLDGGFVGIIPPVRPPGIQFMAWHQEPLVCFVPSGHRLAGSQSVALKALAEESFIAVSHESAPAFASHMQELCKAAGFRPRIILESPRAQAVALMVAAGSGVALLPAALAQFMKTSVHAIPLKGSPKITHVFACQKGRAVGPLGHLLQLLKARKLA
ncbi:DNA-binding transcriptional LysR family regulator [Prosthecobacter fusiformis]|uniref:DNA-binding transcriptional LysR family regulator n=1 Tax=Prosthecobacter fusiformis TaxID=48464 RepID=A0A4R7S3P0_9BACT|nr:LysR substrate-binding domain-containing protein [Prosthecobacter fusiformis]TDU72894.1 DNA-binding transcriptional LysR family regulator [Prosthecobacter fusiformis]